jgi:transposase
MSEARKPYLSDVTDDEWSFCAPYLTLMREDAPQRDYDMREVLNALRWMVKAECQWRSCPTTSRPRPQ